MFLKYFTVPFLAFCALLFAIEAIGQPQQPSLPASNANTILMPPVVLSAPASVDVASDALVESAPPADAGIIVLSVPKAEPSVGIPHGAESPALPGIDGPTLLGICATVATLAKLLVHLLRAFGSRFLAQNQVNKFALMLAAVATGVSSVTPGMTWWQVVFTGLSPIVLTLGPGDHKAT